MVANTFSNFLVCQFLNFKGSRKKCGAFPTVRTNGVTTRLLVFLNIDCTRARDETNATNIRFLFV